MEPWVQLSEIVRNLAFAGVAVIGLYAAWQRMRAATRQADASLEQQRIANNALLQEIFTKAVDSLASDSLSIRVSGIVSLGGLGREEDTYKADIVSVLAAYVDEHQAPDTEDVVRRDLAEAIIVLTMLEAD